MGYNLRLLYLLLIFSILLLGCAVTNIVSFKDPSVGDIKYRNLVIYAIMDNLNERIVTEEVFSSEFDNYDVTCTPSIKLFFPTRTYSAEEFDNILFENKIDGVMFVKISNKEETQSLSTVSRNELNVMSGKWERVSHIRTRENTEIIFEISLVDVQNDKSSWVASASSFSVGDSRLLNFKSFILSLAESTTSKMYKDGLIRRNSK